VSRDTLIGVLAGLATVVMWASWIVSTRFGVGGELSSYDLGFLRFTIPAVLLLPVAIRDFGVIRKVHPLRLMLMLYGAGAPFFLLAATGMTFAPASEAGALLPGAMPLFVALLAVLVMGERIGPVRLIGFALIGAGVLAILGDALIEGAGDGRWRGHLFFLAASFSWAVYTIAFRGSGLGVWQGAAVVSVGSAIGYMPIYLIWLEPGLMQASLPTLSLQFVMQGLASGFFSLLFFSTAIAKLGSSRGAAFGSLAPILAWIFAVTFLGEQLDATGIAGVLATSTGVLLASGAFSRSKT
jgi:drug/metabolite transporter (DMT)-like permease